MRCPFPGMDPYLEHPALWPGVHNSLIAAIRDDLAARVAPRHYVALERRTYRLTLGDPTFVGRPGVAVVAPAAPGVPAPVSPSGAATVEGSSATGIATNGSAAVLEIEVPMVDEVAESYLEVRDVGAGDLITLVEVLSPANKLPGPGRRAYEAKRGEVFATRTNLVEIDLLRDGEPMPVVGPVRRSDYRILVTAGHRRPHGRPYLFGLRDAFPVFPLPLKPDDAAVDVDLGAILHDLYDRARFDLQVDYGAPPVPPLADADGEWARGRVGAAKRGDEGE